MVFIFLLGPEVLTELIGSCSEAKVKVPENHVVTLSRDNDGKAKCSEGDKFLCMIVVGPFLVFCCCFLFVVFLYAKSSDSYFTFMFSLSLYDD